MIRMIIFDFQIGVPLFWETTRYFDCNGWPMNCLEVGAL